MKKILLFCIICFLLSSQTLINAQNLGNPYIGVGYKHSNTKSGSSLQFDSIKYDFGKILEAKGSVSHRFIFKNIGTKDIKITKVLPTCGCTTSEWSKDPIKQGMTGFVDATYNPKNRPAGPFMKTIIVRSDQDPDSVVLIIKGDILRVNTIQDSFNYQVGSIGFMTNTMGFGQLSNKITDTSENMLIKNFSDSVIIIKAFNDMGNNFIFVKNLPISIPPHSKILLPINYSANKIKSVGGVNSRVAFITTDSLVPLKRIFIYAYIH